MPGLLLAQDPVLPEVPVGDGFQWLVDWLQGNAEPLFDLMDAAGTFLYNLTLSGLSFLPPLVMVAIFALLGWWLRGWKFAIFAFLAMALIASMGHWRPAMETLTLVLIATFVAVIISVPMGIIAAYNDSVSQTIRPVLDFMQTLPPFVYLIPAVVFFGIGVVPGMVATVIFAMPPGVRFTELGIRQVDPEMVEAGEAFGARPLQILTKVQVPLSLPTILGGINQVIMLALSMVVVAGLVGAGGLGALVFQAITRLDESLGFSSGLAVVLLAIYLDRLTQSLGSRSAVKRAESAAQGM